MANSASSVRLLPELASVNQVVLELFRLYQPAFALKRLGTGLDLDPVAPLTWADRSQLEVGLSHLFNNALKHTQHGGLIVCRTALDGEWVKLTIGDNGPGVSPEEEACFEPNGGSDGALRSESGLYLSRAIVAAHGGDIVLDRSYGSGSWIVVRLPGMAMQNAHLVDTLEQAHRDRSDLVATLSYELRTPLNVIMGYIDLLLDGAFGMLGGLQVDTVRRMDRAARELLGLINEAIEMTYWQAGRLPLDLRSFQLPEIIRRFCRLVAEVLGCDFGHTFLWQRANDTFVAVTGHGDTAEQWEWMRGLRVPALKVMRLLARRQSEQSPIVAEPRDWLPADAGALGLQRCLVLPLQRGGEVLGVMTAGDRGRAHGFGDEQVRLAQGIADLASLALDNARLIDELERTKRVKADFVSGLSHQFRIPLNVVIGYTDLLLDGEFGDLQAQQRRVLSHVRRSALDLLDAVSRVLDASRFEAAARG